MDVEVKNCSQTNYITLRYQYQWSWWNPTPNEPLFIENLHQCHYICQQLIYKFILAELLQRKSQITQPHTHPDWATRERSHMRPNRGGRGFVAHMHLVPNTDNRGASSPIILHLKVISEKICKNPVNTEKTFSKYYNVGKTQSPRWEFHTIPIGPQLQAVMDL
jgi:hypothetical protein